MKSDMNVRSVAPSQLARPFATNEMFFSATDAKGRILEGNEAFARISGYALKDLINQPHNIIRHPHMPRAAFAVLWGNLSAGKPFNGYVLNMAKDGAHYWVVAHAAPTIVDGAIVAYHSNRRRPDRSAIDAIEPLYRALVDEEHRHARRSDAIEASTALLERFLAERGQTYDEFVWSITGVAV